MHWYSYLLGLATLPLALLLVLGVRSLIDRLNLGQTRRLRTLSYEPGSTHSALEFTPRLVGKIGHPDDGGEQPAKAS